MGVSKHEERDVSFNAVVLFAASLVIALVVVHFVVTGLFHHFAFRRPNYPSPSPLAENQQQLAGPHLVVNQAVDMEKLRASENATLNSYGWVDRERGVVRIPIEQAMEIMAKER